MKTIECWALAWIQVDLQAPRLGLRASLRALWSQMVTEPLVRRRVRSDAAWAVREVALRRAYFLALSGGVR
ncbi:hypothetical protein LBMAG56_36740 [Verrucomicrobiota bacterium]|nr:hypothetical protein LBMAG56_36740 [Verrucomicrobiota bacterium]